MMPALFGCALIPLGAALGWYYFKERAGALLLATFIAGETMLIAYSRTGLLDGIFVFFILATLLAALLVERRGQVLWPAVLLGLAVAVKWAALPVAVPVGYVMWRKGLFRPFLASLWLSAGIYIAIVYVGQLANPTGAGRVFNDQNTLMNVVQWHRQALKNVFNAVSSNQASPWWSWPLMMRPVLFFHKAYAAGMESTVLAIGNPLVWWASTLAVATGIFELGRRAILRRPVADHPLVPILLGYMFLLLPWVLGTRIPYLYNYLPSYAFALLALVYWLCRLWNHRPWGRWVVIAFAACVVATALYFLPLTMALPISHEYLRQHIWLESWDHIQFN